MKQFLLIMIAAICVSAQSLAADKGQAMDPKMMETMKKYQAAGTPGEPHKVLSNLAGKWKTSSKMWHKPDAPAETSKGTANFKMILGGRWLQQEFKGTAMGQPYQGMGLVGYDNVKGKYESTWYDSMSTGLMTAEGDYNPATKTLTDKGSASCPISADKTQEFRSDWQMVDKNKMVFSMFGAAPEGGPEFKMMEITYTR